MFDREDHESLESLSNLERAQKGLLSPASNANETTTAQTSRKRKLADVEHVNDLGKAFTIKAHPSFPSAQTQKLIPRLQLPRSCLPLAYLDMLGGQEGLPISNLFSAYIKVLEGTSDDDRQSCQPTVLIAQSAIDDGLFAIERVREGIYANCRLGNWVTMNALERLQTIPMDVVRLQKRQRQEQGRPQADQWWGSAAIGIKFEDSCKVRKDPAMDKNRGMRIFLHMPQIKLTTPAQETQELSSSVLQSQTGNVLEDTVEKDTVEKAAQDPEEVLKMVRTQYQDALYTSKSSLAYFAKGPLSRARAAFNVNDGSAHDPSHLTSFLRSCILSLATMDKKYRETLPDLIKGFPFDSLSDEDCTTVIDTISKKARRSKRISVGKNGLFPGEEVKIARWWLGRDTSSVTCESANAKEEATKSMLLEQRIRETQMQIVLSLETLALESAATTHAVGNLSPTNPTEGDDDSQNKKMKKKSKPQDLSMMLDLLVDRLCIWQSMSVDETKTTDGGGRPTSQHGVKSTAKLAGSDYLRQFCIDVVLPFYGARQPELTTLLCNKLGGPKKTSPRRSLLTKSVSSCASLKPGTLAEKQQIRKPRRTLERVLTDERSASRKPPSLSRSATDSVLPQLKREVSDTSLSSIPLNRVAMHKRYSQREVDLQATSQAAEAKIKKKARVEQELQGAIAALKKPNPRMAVKELVEDAERRATASHSRKPKNPVRNPFAPGAQVMATPSNNRHKDVYGGLPHAPRQNIAPLPDLEEVPPSSISCVPSSSRKAQRSPFLAPDSTGKIGGSALPVAETPTRGPSKLWGRPPISSAAIGFLAASCQPSPRSAGENALENSTKNVSPPRPQDKEESIYAALGWDDVDELL